MSIANILLGIGGKSSTKFTMTGGYSVVGGVTRLEYLSENYPYASAMGSLTPQVYAGREIMGAFQYSDEFHVYVEGDARGWWHYNRIYSITHGTSFSVDDATVTYYDGDVFTTFRHHGVLLSTYLTQTTQEFFIETK